MIEGDRVRVSVRVEVPRERCFELFTAHIDQWWRRGPAYRVSGKQRSVLHLEPGVGGRLYESFLDRRGGERVIATGTVKRWDPPAGFVLEWAAVNFRSDEATMVTVDFEDLGHATRVTVVHEGWASIRPDHPARHGKPPAAFLRELGLWWGSLMRALQEHART